MKECFTCNYRTIPIFIPGAACPHHCIYCNQQVISGQLQIPSDEEILAMVTQNLATIPVFSHVEIGFFGGTFTGLPLQQQEHLLQLVQPFIKSGQVKNLRCSTHPLTVNKESLALLKRYKMNTVELGVQSLDDDVLQQVGRGYTAQHVYDAAALIRSMDIHLGMQLMVGLPGDTAEKSLFTAHRIVACGADNVRIYPTLVVQHTALAELYRQGQYKALSIEEAVERVKGPLRYFQEHDVAVLRVGLHPTDGFINGTDYLAGPFHVSFRELVQTAIWNDIFVEKLSEIGIDVSTAENDLLTTPPVRQIGSAEIAVSPHQLNSAVGYNASNKKMLQQHFRRVRFLPDSALRNYQFTLHIND